MTEQFPYYIEPLLLTQEITEKSNLHYAFHIHNILLLKFKLYIPWSFKVNNKHMLLHSGLIRQVKPLQKSWFFGHSTNPNLGRTKNSTYLILSAICSPRCLSHTLLHQSKCVSFF